MPKFTLNILWCSCIKILKLCLAIVQHAREGETMGYIGTKNFNHRVIDLQSKSMNWFLYDWNLHHERVKFLLAIYQF